jgi:hypothetical protein
MLGRRASRRGHLDRDVAELANVDQVLKLGAQGVPSIYLPVQRGLGDGADRAQIRQCPTPRPYGVTTWGVCVKISRQGLRRRFPGHARSWAA